MTFFSCGVRSRCPPVTAGTGVPFAASPLCVTVVPAVAQAESAKPAAKAAITLVTDAPKVCSLAVSRTPNSPPCW